jgi:hypothetical protein
MNNGNDLLKRKIFMQNLTDNSREMFEFYSNILVSVAPDWIAEEDRGISNIQHLTENDYERTVLNFDQLNRNGENSYPVIVIELGLTENNIEGKPYLSIYKKNYLWWENIVYFPLNDDFVRYTPRESFKKWLKYSIKYRSKTKLRRKFNRFLHRSKRKEIQRASQVLLGSQKPFRSEMDGFLQQSRRIVSKHRRMTDSD